MTTTLNTHPMPKKGDRVRVVVEGEVSQVGDRQGWFMLSTGFNGYGHAVDLESPVTKSIEILPFSPGQRVRAKNVPHYEYTLGENGYFAHEVNRVVISKEVFTSERYELVDA